MTSPRIVFAGTPEFSVPCLSALLDLNANIVGVYTQPDRVAGRGKKIQQSAVKQRALKAGIAVFQPENFKTVEARQSLANLKPDLMIVVAYGLILPQSVLDIPRLGCINVHASLLPRWRGAAPIQRAIEAGDEQTGVCLMQMEKGLDTGPVLAQAQQAISADETGGHLHDALSAMGASLLGENLSALLAGQLTAIKQTDPGLSYAHKLDKAETRVDWQQSAGQISNKIRAFNPWPVVSTQIEGQVLRLHQASPIEQATQTGLEPGTVIAINSNGIDIQTGSGSLRIQQLQKPGGKILQARDFLNGFKLAVGQRFV